jgi:hypothetical protein
MVALFLFLTGVMGALEPFCYLVCISIRVGLSGQCKKMGSSGI